MTDPCTLTSTDGAVLEGEVAPAATGAARAACVLCHPHPRYGGSMRSLVISELFRALPAAGVTALRFNFRGVEASTGTWSSGHGERADVAAAVEHATGLAPDAPLLLAGWSFGADMALATTDARVAAWFAVAAPLRYTTDDDLAVIGGDPRPKLLALAEHDEVRSAAEVAELAAGWRATEVEVVAGASHFFVGRTDRLVALALEFVDTTLAPR